MIVNLNRKVRDRVPTPTPAAPKKCSPPRPGNGGRRGRKSRAGAPALSAAPEALEATRSSLPSNLKASVEALGRGIIRALERVLESAYAAEPRPPIARLLERDIPDWANATGRAAMEALLVHERGFLGTTLACSHCKTGMLKLEGDRPRTIRTKCGGIRTKRSYYVCESCGTGVAPLDVQLGLDGDHGFLPGVQEVVALMGSQLSFPDSTQLLERLLPDAPSLTTVERITRTLGKAAQEERDGERRAAYQDPANSTFSPVRVSGSGVSEAVGTSADESRGTPAALPARS